MSRGSTGNDSSLTSVQARRFSSSGDPQGVEFQVNTYTLDYQEYPAVSRNANGFVVVWENEPGFRTPKLVVSGLPLMALRKERNSP